MLIPFHMHETNYKLYILYNIHPKMSVVYLVVAAADNTDIAGDADHVLQEGEFIDIHITGADCLNASGSVPVAAFTEHLGPFHGSCPVYRFHELTLSVYSRESCYAPYGVDDGNGQNRILTKLSQGCQ